MNVFIPFSLPYSTARVLDARRLNKQIIECDWIIKAKEGDRIFNHPAVQMWKPYLEYLDLYRVALQAYKEGDFELSLEISKQSIQKIPPFFWYTPIFHQHRARLYTKDPVHYKLFESEGATDINFYVQTLCNKNQKSYVLQQTQNGKYISTIDITQKILLKRDEFYHTVNLDKFK